MPFLFLKPLPEWVNATKTHPELPTSENSPETSLPMEWGTWITQRGAGPGAHPSCTATVIPNKLKIMLKKKIKVEVVVAYMRLMLTLGLNE